MSTSTTSRPGSAPAPAPAPVPAPLIDPPRSLGRLGLLAVLTGTFLPMLDFFIVNVALPTINADLHASPATLELVVAGYAMAYAVLLVVGGRLGDHLGRRRVFLIGMAGFTVASLLCGLAPSAGWLVAARVLQGATAALMVPQVLATLHVTTSGEARSRALGVFGAVGGVAAVAGQLLGGVLVSANLFGSGWRSIFLVNVPVGIVAWVLARRHVPDTRSEHPASVDVAGTALFGAAMLTLLVPLTEGRSLGWPWWTWALLAVLPFLATAFVLVERRVEARGAVPLVPPSLVRLHGVRTGLLLALPFFVGFGGFMFVVALTLQTGLGMGPLEDGLAITPMAVSFFAASLLSARLVARFGRRVLTAGVLVQAVGLLMLAAVSWREWPAVSIVELAPGMVVAGFGQGMSMSTLFRVVLAEVPAASAGIGGGVMATTQQVSLALGVATLGSIFLALATSSDGVRDGFVLVLAIQAVLAVLLAVGSTRLPVRTTAHR